MALVVIVDDSRMARAFAAASLRQGGQDVAEVDPTSLECVMDRLRVLKPAVLLLDQQMPGFPGSSLVRACFEDDALSSVKVVMLTAQRDEEMEHRMAKLGVHVVLHKPISPHDLNHCVVELLNQ